jgi:large subunit ribosomal protein L9
MRKYTEVILTHNIVGLGAESDQVKVAPGYARNFLLPQGLAIPLTSANKRQIEVLRQRRAEREAHELNTMTDLAKSLSKLTLVVKVKTGDDGKMFGAVTSGTIADELKHQFDVSLDKKKIHLDHPIKAVGDYDVEFRLHPEVNTTLKVRVESTTPPPETAEAPEGKAKEGRPERRGREPKGAQATADDKGAPRGDRPARGPRAGTDRVPRAPRPERPARKEKPAKAE